MDWPPEDILNESFRSKLWGSADNAAHFRIGWIAFNEAGFEKLDPVDIK
jgi:hypothetical protein